MAPICVIMEFVVTWTVYMIVTKDNDITKALWYLGSENRRTAFDMTIACLPPALVCSWWLISLPFWICPLTHWGRLTLICVSKLTTIGSDNGRRQAIIWTNDGMLLIRTSRTNFNKILSDIRAFHSRKCIGTCHLWYGGNFASASMC